LKIRDNGLGINLEKHKNDIFGLYKRFHTHIEGKGMGLYLVNVQIESLGGSIEINSKVNEFTEFIINIPILQS
jgi:sensor histidine kinase regulating citrate/malate metabolism